VNPEQKLSGNRTQELRGAASGQIFALTKGNPLVCAPSICHNFNAYLSGQHPCLFHYI